MRHEPQTLLAQKGFQDLLADLPGARGHRRGSLDFFEHCEPSSPVRTLLDLLPPPLDLLPPPLPPLYPSESPENDINKVNVNNMQAR